MTPSNNDYIQKMKELLYKRNIEVKLLRYITPITLFHILYLKLKGYSIFHFHFVYVFPYSIFMKVFIKFCKLLGFKIVFTVHNIVPHKSNKANIEKNKWLYNNSDFRFVHYETNKKRLKDLGLKTDNLLVIDHPIYNIYENLITQKQAREKLGISKTKKVALCFGYIRKYKGLEYFVESLESLGNEYIGLIVGKSKDTGLIDFLRKKEKEMKNLKVIDKFVAQNEIQLYLNACDVVVLPYLEISTSGAALLAYAFSKPVVASDVGCMRDVVDEKTGVLIKPKDAESLAKGIEKIFTYDYNSMGKFANKRAQEKYSWEKMIDSTEQIYQRIKS